MTDKMDNIDQMDHVHQMNPVAGAEIVDETSRDGLEGPDTKAEVRHNYMSVSSLLDDGPPETNKPPEAESDQSINNPYTGEPLTYTNSGRVAYKSFKKKYRKMKLQFDRAIAESDELYNGENRAKKIFNKLARQNNSLLDILIGLNDSEHLNPELRIDLSKELDTTDDTLDPAYADDYQFLMSQYFEYESDEKILRPKRNPMSILSWLKRNHPQVFFQGGNMNTAAVTASSVPQPSSSSDSTTLNGANSNNPSAMADDIAAKAPKKRRPAPSEPVIIEGVEGVTRPKKRKVVSSAAPVAALIESTNESGGSNTVESTKVDIQSIISPAVNPPVSVAQPPAI